MSTTDPLHTDARDDVVRPDGDETADDSPRRPFVRPDIPVGFGHGGVTTWDDEEPF